MQLNLSNKLIFFAIDKTYDVDFIKSFVSFKENFNSDDGFYLINNEHDIYSPSYANALISKYPFKKHSLLYLLKDIIKSIKKTEDDNNRYLLVITDSEEIMSEKLKDNLSQLNVKYLIKNSIDLETINFCFKGNKDD